MSSPLVAALVACGVLAGGTLVQRKTLRVASSEPAPRAFPFRAAVVRCSDADVSDDYRFEITNGRDGAFQIGITEASGALRERIASARAGSAKVDVVVRGQLHSHDAERYATTKDVWPDSGELLLLRDLGEDRDVNVVARLARGDMVVVELRSLE